MLANLQTSLGGKKMSNPMVKDSIARRWAATKAEQDFEANLASASHAQASFQEALEGVEVKPEPPGTQAEVDFSRPWQRTYVPIDRLWVIRDANGTKVIEVKARPGTDSDKQLGTSIAAIPEMLELLVSLANQKRKAEDKQKIMSVVRLATGESA
jgi:hypothetical protein